MKLVMNEKRKAIIEVLKNATSPMTLEELGTAIGSEVRSGVTNKMVEAGLIRVTGKRIRKCPVCGNKSPVNEYAIGDISVLEKVEK